MDGLKSFQREIQAGTLYRTTAAPALGGSTSSNASSQLRPNIEVVGDTVDVHGSQLFPAAAPTGMPVMFNELEGFQAFDFVPNFIYVAGTPDSVVLTGINALPVGQLAADAESVTYSDADLTDIAAHQIAADAYSETFADADLQTS